MKNLKKLLAIPALAISVALYRKVKDIRKKKDGSESEPVNDKKEENTAKEDK